MDAVELEIGALGDCSALVTFKGELDMVLAAMAGDVVKFRVRVVASSTPRVRLRTRWRDCWVWVFILKFMGVPPFSL